MSSNFFPVYMFAKCLNYAVYHIYLRGGSEVRIYSCTLLPTSKAKVIRPNSPRSNVCSCPHTAGKPGIWNLQTIAAISNSHQGKSGGCETGFGKYI